MSENFSNGTKTPNKQNKPSNAIHNFVFRCMGRKLYQNNWMFVSDTAGLNSTKLFDLIEYFIASIRMLSVLKSIIGVCYLRTPIVLQLQFFVFIVNILCKYKCLGGLKYTSLGRLYILLWIFSSLHVLKP